MDSMLRLENINKKRELLFSTSASFYLIPLSWFKSGSVAVDLYSRLALS